MKNAIKVSFKIDQVPMSSLDINSLKNSKRQQLIGQELVENTEKLNYKSSYFSHKKKDN